MMKKILLIILLMTAQSLQADSDFNRARMIAMRHIRNNDFEQALDAFNQYLKVHPDNIYAYIEIAQVYMNLRDQDAAIRTILNGLANNPRASGLYMKMGDIYFSLQDYGNVIKYLKLMLNTCPGEEIDTECNKIYKLIGVSYFLKYDHENALLYLKKYQNLVFNDPEAYKYISLTYQNFNDKKRSNAYQEMNALLLNQSGISRNNFYYKQGVIFLKNGIYTEALNVLLRIAQARKNDHRLMFNIGMGYLLIREYPESILYVKRASELWDRKKLNFNKLIKLDNTGGKYALVLSLAYYLNKETGKAAETYKKVEDFDRYFFNYYKGDYKRGVHSKLYKQLPAMWED
ncbi:MAG: tetratricopeptide repeat protein [bacterium]|nr:tetratricopeptide repeat protein [bacterium]